MPSTTSTSTPAWTPGAAPVRLSLAHPAPYDADVARTLPESERSWRLISIPVRGEPREVTAEQLGRYRGWYPLPAVGVDLDPGVYVLQTGPRNGPHSVRARFRVSERGEVVPASGCTRLVTGSWYTAAEYSPVCAAAGASYRAMGAPPSDPPAALTANAAAIAAASYRATGAPPSDRPTLAVTPVAGDDVSATAKARTLAAEAVLTAAGVPLPPPVYEHGYRVVQMGVDNYVKSHHAWADQPTTVEGLEGVRDAVRREERREVVLPNRGDLRMDDGGRLVLPGHGPVPCELHALRGLAGLFGDTLPQAGAMLAVLPPDERADLFNRQAQRSGRRDEIRLRVRTGPSGPAVYALVAPTYAAHDADALAGTLIDALRDLPGGVEARGEVSYDPETTRLRADAIWHADRVVDLAAGDVFKVGMRFSADDSGGGSIRGDLSASRNRCRNLLVVSVTRAASFRVVHRGDTASMADRVAAGVRKAGETTEHFTAQWGYLRRPGAVVAELTGGSEDSAVVARVRAALLLGAKDADRYVDAVASATTTRDAVGAVYGAIADTKLDGVDWPVRRDALVELFLRGWDAEQGVLAADVINGVTRVHEAAIPVEHKVRIERSVGFVAAALAGAVA